MDEMQRIAQDTLDLAQGLTAGGGTFKCPSCGTKVLKQTGFCVKCKKKVKESSEREADDQADPWFPVEHVRQMCASCADKMERKGLAKIRRSHFLQAVGLDRYAKMTWEACIEDAKKTGKTDPQKFCGWLYWHGPNAEKHGK